MFMILDSKVEPSFAGKVALIVGASRGIGAVTARAFAHAGAAVVVAARDRQALDSVVEDIRAEGGQALGVPTEVTDASSVEHLVKNAIRPSAALTQRSTTRRTVRYPRCSPISIQGISIAASARIFSERFWE
jgi:NAD(P)-dependent dehydrogenase (short-subunit alcohol dehydrogenase family)